MRLKAARLPGCIPNGEFCFHKLQVPRAPQFEGCAKVRQDHPAVAVVPLMDHAEGGAGATANAEDRYIHVLVLSALALKPGFDKSVMAVCTPFGVVVKTAAPKGHARMTNKMLSAVDHRYEPEPRTANNIDVVRVCVTFETAAQLAAAAAALAASMLVARVKNMFRFGKPQAEAQLHYRTVMVNVVFEPGTTYGDLAKDEALRAVWEGYIEGRPGNPGVAWEHWRRQARAAATSLGRAALAGRDPRSTPQSKVRTDKLRV